MSAPQSAREVANAAIAAFGGELSVRGYYDEPESNCVDILACEDRPTPGYTSYSTLDLHLAPNLLESKDIRVEMAGVADSQATEFPNLLATAAFYVIKNGWLCVPGVVFPSLVSEYELSDQLEHLLWVPPFPWEELSGVEVSDGRSVHWLLAVPISDSECRFLEESGFDRLEKLFADQEIDYFDLSRRPVV